MTKFVFFCDYNEDGEGVRYDEKYIIADVIKDGQSEQEIHFVSLPLGYHSDIARSYSRRLDMCEGKKIREVLGGGIVTIDSSKREVLTYGRSGGYGPPDEDQVLQVLQETIGREEPAWSISVTITNYIRG